MSAGNAIVFWIAQQVAHVLVFIMALGVILAGIVAAQWWHDRRRGP